MRLSSAMFRKCLLFLVVLGNCYSETIKSQMLPLRNHIADANLIAVKAQEVSNEGSSATGSDVPSTPQKSATATERLEIQNYMNNLRRTVSSSNIPYMTYSTSSESEAAAWTSYCNWDLAFSATAAGSLFATASYKGSSFSYQDALLSQFTKFRTPMSSIYLTSLGCSLRYCSTATINGNSYSGVTMEACYFRGDSRFDNAVIQYSLGEACTKCGSGSFWCDYGLCRADCSAANPDCYCNPICYNCASVEQTSCTCQCISGWSGPQCSAGSSTTPTCTTTPHVPRSITTMSLNPTTPNISMRDRASYVVVSVLLFLSSFAVLFA